MNRDYVEKRLLEIGIPASRKGFRYIADAIMLLLSPDWECDKITAIYHKLASIHKTSPCNVEHGIRGAFQAARNEYPEASDKYLGSYYTNNKNTLFHLIKQLSFEEGGAAA